MRYRRRKSTDSSSNISCHRFESDMLAFSGCYYGGGDKERTELGAIRKRWKSLHVRPQLFLKETLDFLSSVCLKSHVYIGITCR